MIPTRQPFLCIWILLRGWCRDSYLGHDVAYVVNALGDRLAASRHSDCALRRVWEHLARHLDRGSRDLSDLLDLRAALANQGAALGRGHHQPEGDGRPGDVGSQRCIEVFLEFLADQRECLVDRLAAAYYCDYALWTRPVSDVNFCPTLQGNKFVGRQRTLSPQPTSSRNLFTMSPFLPIMLPTSYNWKVIDRISDVVSGWLQKKRICIGYKIEHQ